MYYIMDTNIWVDVTQGKIPCNDLSGKVGAVVVVAPFMIVELVRATVRGGEKYFLGDRKMFECMERLNILSVTASEPSTSKPLRKSLPGFLAEGATP